MTDFKVGDEAIFVKSWTKVKVIEVLNDGYTVKKIDDGKEMFVTKNGLLNPYTNRYITPQTEREE